MTKKYCVWGWNLLQFISLYLPSSQVKTIFLAFEQKFDKSMIFFLYEGVYVKARQTRNQNLFMGRKVVLTRLCHGLTLAVQLLEKLFYLHTLNDLLTVSLHKYEQPLLYTPLSIFSIFFSRFAFHTVRSIAKP